MRVLSTLAVGIMCLLIHISIAGQKVEDGWKKLSTFKSNKADVDKALGIARKTKAWSVYPFEYLTNEALVSVRFSGPACDENQEPFFRHNIPSDILLEYEVKLSRAVPLSEFSFDKARFERDVAKSKDGEALPYFTYRQFLKELWKVPNEWGAGTGIEFWGDIIDGQDYVTGFHYGRPYGAAEKVRCDATH